MQIQVWDEERKAAVIYDSELTPMRICISEDEKKDISSMIGKSDPDGNPIDIYNAYPKDMSEKEFFDKMEEKK
jgi:hypothetical protein